MGAGAVVAVAVISVVAGACMFLFQGQKLSECGQLLAAEHRLKGDRNAHEEI
jgi:hypothetical protein